MDDRHARHRRPSADRRRRPADGFRTSSSTRFGRLASDAVSALPKGLMARLDGVVVSIEDVPPAAATDRDLGPALARYEPAGQGHEPSTSSTPGRVVVYRRPLEARARSRHELFELIRESVVLELADHLGIDDEGLDELGWP